MTKPMPDDRSSLREFVDRWRRAGKALARLEAEELRTVDQRPAIRLAAAATRVTISVDPPGASSGLVELQRWFLAFRARHGDSDASGPRPTGSERPRGEEHERR